ncbi:MULTISPECIES: alanine racemase [Actinokineospora]|uniref:Amino acid deaminase n=1 Tax=Actinokineospora fastidiosa TaxID=1816 RepID=A0A918GR52_9PSEU|nr:MULTISPECIES: alanine racemase [Actinokineospora]UVS78977.1 D-threonine aldolase [Actinokineospora sp. UTMC 2448]GGS55651.1 amino acid deaminase [Actinokineospora fastidiosa]
MNASLDRSAVARLRDEPLDWRFRQVPTGRTLGETAAARPNLFRDGFLGPLVVLDEAALEHNLTTLADWSARQGLALAPHGKTTMAPALFARQLDLGAWAITVAHAGQARVCRAFGVTRVLVANEFTDPGGLAWLSGELADPGFEFLCFADSVEAVDLMTRGLAGAPRPIDVLVEVGMAGGRTGVRDLAEATAVAKAVSASPALRLAGVAGYEGPAASTADVEGLSAVWSYLDALRTAAVSLHPMVETPRTIVTAGGSAYFDVVAASLTGAWPMPVLPVLRSGAYITHDDGFYRDVSPLGATPRLTGVPPLKPALTAWAQVSSRPEPGLALLAAGKRDLSHDLGMPRPRLHRTADGVTPLEGCEVTAMNDQHTYLRVPADHPLSIGDWVALGISHPCTTFDKWPLIPVTAEDGETVVDLIRTFF